MISEPSPSKDCISRGAPSEGRPLSFIIPPSSTLKSVKEAISAIHSTIDDPQYLKLHQKEPLFVMPVNINIGEICLKGYAYYDQKRE
ncbi:Uncharacterised protein [uncultured archaeon]|nr:Uncharacterised protein [uncultured archaeon]